MSASLCNVENLLFLHIFPAGAFCIESPILKMLMMVLGSLLRTTGQEHWGKRKPMLKKRAEVTRPPCMLMLVCSLSHRCVCGLGAVHHGRASQRVRGSSRRFESVWCGWWRQLPSPCRQCAHRRSPSDLVLWHRNRRAQQNIVTTESKLPWCETSEQQRPGREDAIDAMLPGTRRNSRRIGP